jgi:uncharacterized protein YjdB
MSKLVKLIIVSFIVSFSLLGCAEIMEFLGLEEEGNDPIIVTGVTIDALAEEFELLVGETLQLGADVTPNDAELQDVEWDSSDSDLVLVDQDGLVTAVAVTGDAGVEITVTTDDGDYTDSVTIVVVEELIAVESVSIDETAIELDVDDTYQLDATVLPVDASNQGISWDSTDFNIAAVDNDGLVTAINGGVATITVSTFDGDLRDTVEVTVNVPVTGVSIAQDAIEVGETRTFQFRLSRNPP